MYRDPFDNPERKRITQNFTDVLIRSISKSNQVGLIALLAQVIAIMFQILSVGAKLLTRRKLGIRTAGRIKFIAHMIFILALIFLTPILKILISSSKIDINPTERIYLLIYLSIISVLWIKNFIDFKNRKGSEAYTFFRGYGFFTSTSNPDSISNRWSRLTDPFILAALTLAGWHFLGDSFKLLVKLLSMSACVLFIEECLFIYDEYNNDFDFKDAKSQIFYFLLLGAFCLL